jgi:hypothetical protein
MQPGEEFLCHDDGSSDDISSVWHRRIRKCISKLILLSHEIMKYLVVFDNEHSLHLKKDSLALELLKEN